MTANIITASLVKELRERTGSGMMECKKALEASGGDIEVAIDAMRKSGQAKAAKKAGRIAAEGAILIKISADGKLAFIAEVNCETDFVARDNGFIEFANQVVASGLAAKVTNLEALMALTLANGKTVAQAREDLVAKIGENINVRRVALVQAQGVIGSYIHGNNRIGVLVQLSVAKPELGKDIAMHIAASKPVAVNPEELPAGLLANEKAVYLAQVQDSGKPAEILEKMVTGRLQKFIAESTLVKQPFVKNPDITIEKLLQQEQAQVTGFVRFEVGEGIEKPTADFADEVQKMIKS